MPDRDHAIPRLQAILTLIDGILSAARGKAYDSVRGNFLFERALERVVELIDEAALPLPADLGPRFPQAAFAPVTGLASRLLDNDYRIGHEEMWRLITRELPVLQTAIKQIMVDYDYTI